MLDNVTSIRHAAPVPAPVLGAVARRERIARNEVGYFAFLFIALALVFAAE